MYNLKKTLFLNLTARQKSALLSYLQAFIKKNAKLNKYEILDKFLEEEKYYFKIEQTHFHFVIENIENEALKESFTNEILKFIDGALYHFEMLEKHKPDPAKQKEFAKQARKKAQDFKMSKEKPTQKQLKYYEKLTKSRGLEPENLEGASKLDLRDKIMAILEPLGGCDEEDN